MRFIAIYFLCTVAVAQQNLGLPSLAVPEDNPQSANKIALGKKLFFDRRFSRDGTISCASCHQPKYAFTDNLPLAVGIDGNIGSRNTPTILNSAFFASLFLDGRAASLEEQALQPMLNIIEHGFSNQQQILEVVLGDEGYKKRFSQIFAIAAGKITSKHIARAIASFERTLIGGNSPFDQYYFAANKSRLSASSARGLRLFRRKGNCANCHEISWDNALFTDNRFYNIGIGAAALAKLPKPLSPADLPALDSQQRSHTGRFAVTGNSDDIGKFKTPTLRNIALTAPYMHDGSIKTLMEVVEYYNKGGNHSPWTDAAIFRLHLTPQEKSDLVNFMQSLTSPAYRKVEPPPV